MKPVSAKLRAAANVIEVVGKAIEDSQVEDGDPPFAIPGQELLALGKAIKAVEEAMKKLTPEEVEDHERT